MRKIICAIALTAPSVAMADLIDLWTLPTIQAPSERVQEKFYNSCGIRGKRIEGLDQVSCFQEKLGRWFAENYPSQMRPIFDEYRALDLRGRKNQEKAFTDLCTESRRRGDTYGVDVGCAALLKGTLDAGLPRDEFGIVGETAPPATSSVPGLKIPLGEFNGQQFALLAETVTANADRRTATIVTTELASNAIAKTKIAADCSKGVITDDIASGSNESNWQWNKPRFNIEAEALKAVCM